MGLGYFLHGHLKFSFGANQFAMPKYVTIYFEYFTLLTKGLIFDIFGIEIVVIGYLSGTSFVGIFLRD